MPRFTSCLALTAAVLTLPLIAGAQETVTPADTTGTGLIVGQVVDAASNNPLNGVVVRLSGRPAPDAIPGASAPSALQVMTGADGRFVFRDLPKGSFTIISTKGGYLDGAYGRLRPGGGVQPVAFEDGQRVGVVSLSMWKHAAISGTIVDEAGEPVIGVPVRAMRRTTALIGRRRFVNAGTSSTDGRGMYRIPCSIRTITSCALSRHNWRCRRPRSRNSRVACRPEGHPATPREPRCSRRCSTLAEAAR